MQIDSKHNELNSFQFKVVVEQKSIRTSFSFRPREKKEVPPTQMSPVLLCPDAGLILADSRQQSVGEGMPAMAA